MSEVQVESIIPILRIADVEASKTFYVDVLGFTDHWIDESFGSVTRDGLGVYLSKGEQGSCECWLWVGVDDLDPIYEACKAAGVKFRQEPTNHPWAYEMMVEDPDGHVLRIGSGPKEA